MPMKPYVVTEHSLSQAIMHLINEKHHCDTNVIARFVNVFGDSAKTAIAQVLNDIDTYETYVNSTKRMSDDSDVKLSVTTFHQMFSYDYVEDDGEYLISL